MMYGTLSPLHGHSPEQGKGVTFPCMEAIQWSLGLSTRVVLGSQSFQG